MFADIRFRFHRVPFEDVTHSHPSRCTASMIADRAGRRRLQAVVSRSNKGFKSSNQLAHLGPIVDLRQLMWLRNLLNAALPVLIECREVGMSGTQHGVA